MKKMFAIALAALFAISTGVFAASHMKADKDKGGKMEKMGKMDKTEKMDKKVDAKKADAKK